MGGSLLGWVDVALGSVPGDPMVTQGLPQSEATPYRARPHLPPLVPLPCAPAGPSEHVPAVMSDERPFFHYPSCFIPSLQYLFTASCVLNCVLGTRGHKRNGYFISQLREEKSPAFAFFFSFPLSLLQNHKRSCHSRVCLLVAILSERLSFPQAGAARRPVASLIQKESGIKRG